MDLPNLFIPGAAKSATSSLHDFLGQHPQIFMSRVKEPHFFSKAANFQIDQTAVPSKLEEYARLFSEGQGCLFRGESSTGYMVFPKVVERIHKNIPNPRFIFILRNPIDRAYSHYWWLRGQGQESRPFREALEADLHEAPDPEKRIKNFGGFRFYFAFGQYATYIRPFFSTFGQEKISVMTTETLKSDLITSLNRCFTFLGLAPLHEVIPVKANETIVYEDPALYERIRTIGSQSILAQFIKTRLSDKQFKQVLSVRKTTAGLMARALKKQNNYPKLPANERKWLSVMYRDEVRDLRSMTGLPFDEWGQDFPLE